MEMDFFSQDGIFFRHLDYRPQRITKEEHIISALEARELTTKNFPQTDHAKVTTRSDYRPQLDIIEMICIWESFFPNYENFFQLHQIMDQIIITTRSDTMKRYSRHFEEIVKRW